ncbi:Uncharacterised protein [BD1-7 clade bacterium]|uniref:DUF11 domain-containing protein n=1 Tax=BD1-7 clade bacterium TaxID=2029982 RepID=A0A5S9NML7_9GAMM|nr:Uncharacterised protein [BD1-7 clade bacterium]CAA0094425.1 Uncharacterised protein [BD1-7 clade bacterium]
MVETMVHSQQHSKCSAAMTNGMMQLSGRFASAMLVVFVCLIVSATPAAFALTPANTLISNQATASYKSSDGAQRLATSNSVRTIVTSVAAATLTQDQTRDVLAGGSVVFSHIISNNGNVGDSYTITLTNQTGDGFDFTSLSAFADADANGQPDTVQPLTETPVLAMQESFNIVIVGSIGAGENPGDEAQVQVTATSVLDNAVVLNNTDTAIVVDDAVVDITQSIDLTQGIAGQTPIRITYFYVNSGSRAATAITLDNLLPAGFVYQGNAVWSFGNLPLTDANEEIQGSAPSIIYCAYQPSCAQADRLAFVIDELGAGQSGSVSFDIAIDTAQLPSVIQNTATYDYVPFNGAQITDRSTNTVPFTVVGDESLTLTDDSVIDAVPGTTVFVTHTVTNTGTGSDTFNIRVNQISSNFPLGTVFFLYQSDGLTPLNDSNLDGDLDTGPLPKDNDVDIIIGITLPPSAATGTYSVNLRGTSLQSNNTFADAMATVSVLAPLLAVDLTGIAANGDSACDAGADNCGFEAFDPSDPAVLSQSIDPGQTANFVLYARNLSEIIDLFGFSASIDNTFGSQTLPAGWSVSYTELAGDLIASTGTLSPGGVKAFNVAVTTSETALATTEDLYVQVLSATSLRSDRLRLSVSINEVQSVSLGPDNASTEEPNQFVIYRHELVNDGNATVAFDGIAVALTTPDWSIALYEDTAGGTVDEWDVDDQIITGGFSVAAFTSKTIYVRAFIPSSATPGQVETATVTATFNTGVDQVTAIDVITANPFDIDIVKAQAKDANCDGTEDSAFAVGSFGALPGECIVYRLRVSNFSDITAVNAVIRDATPEYTFYSVTQPTIRCTPAVCVFVSEPAALQTGELEIDVGDIDAGNTVDFFFSVKVSDT